MTKILSGRNVDGHFMGKLVGEKTMLDLVIILLFSLGIFLVCVTLVHNGDVCDAFVHVDVSVVQRSLVQSTLCEKKV